MGGGRRHKAGWAAADGEPHGAERTARRRRSAAMVHRVISHSGLAGVSTVGLAADRTRPASKSGGIEESV